MISAQKINVAARAAVEDRERRVGHKGSYIIGAVVILVGAFLLFRFFGSSKKAPPPPPARPVAVAKVTTKDVPLYLDEIGTCAANESVQVQAQVAGQIVSRNFKDGADVKKGDVLFVIDQRPYQAALDSAKADNVLAQANLQRQLQLKAKGVTATQDLDTAKANAMKTSAAVAAAQVNLDYCTVRSPIDGRAGLRQVDAGNTVSAGSSGPVLVQIDNLDPIYTDFTVAEPDLPLVRRYLSGPHLKVLTDAENDGFPAQEGRLYFIANTVQPGTGTIQARAISANPKLSLWPSEFVHVRLILDELKNVALVPNDAVQTGENGPYVFIVKSDSTLELRQVTPGQKQENDLTVITKGVQAGETVVTRGQLQLAPGDKVVVQETDKAAPNETSTPGEAEKRGQMP
ncbi:MAG TPA: efflux RND transporter periplasmic adaptor subunit [Chthoniobacterales bacterium]|nr:efflux RND transporter periplasmic adaptor subunit [Chthoniobacterales bacterium]